MSEESQSVNFAKELLSQLKLALLALFLLLALSIVVNGVLFFQVLELKSDNSAVAETLRETQDSLLEQKKETSKQNDQAAVKASSRVIQNLYGVNKSLALEIARLEVKYSRQYKVPLHIGLAITAKESGFQPGLTSYNGSSFGLKQINCSAWCKKFGTNRQELLHNLDRNIEFGYRVLSVNMRSAGSLQKALAWYYGSSDAAANDVYAAAVLSKAKQFDLGLG